MPSSRAARVACSASSTRCFFSLISVSLGGRADLHHGDAPRQLRETLLELLAIEVGVRDLDLALDLVDAAADRLRVAGAVDDGGRVARDDDAAGAAELRDLGVLQGQKSGRTSNPINLPITPEDNRDLRRRRRSTPARGRRQARKYAAATAAPAS